MAEVAALVDREIIKKRRHINLPKALAKPIFALLNKVAYWPIGSAPEIELQSVDQAIERGTKTFKDLDIEPAELANLTFHYLQDYRSSSYYDLPPSTERERREEKKYLHVIDDQ